MRRVSDAASRSRSVRRARTSSASMADTEIRMACAASAQLSPSK